MAPIPPAAQTNKELLLDYILRERRVELYHEKSRFFSTRFYLEPTSPEELAKDAQWSSIQGTNDQKAQLYFDKYGAYPKTQHRICGMRPVEDPNGKISVGGKILPHERFWKETAYSSRSTTSSRSRPKSCSGPTFRKTPTGN